MTRRKNRIRLLCALLMLLLSVQTVAAQAKTGFELLDTGKSIDPGLGMTSGGIAGTINTVRLIVPANRIEASEYDVRIEFNLPQGVTADIDAVSLTNLSSSFSAPFEVLNNGNRFIYRTDLLSNGNDGVMDFTFKDLKLPRDFEDWKVTVEITVAGTRLIEPASLDIAYTSRVYYQASSGNSAAVSPLAPFVQSAGPFRFKQTSVNFPRNVKVTLPRGFSWDMSVTQVEVKPISGFLSEERQLIPVRYEDPNVQRTAARIAVFDFEKLVNLDERKAAEWEVEGGYQESGLLIMVNAENALAGDVVADISNSTPSNLPVAAYSIRRVDTEGLEYQKQDFQEKAPLVGFAVTERAAGELRPGDTITVTLPKGASWDYVEESNGQIRPASNPQVTSGSETNGIEFEKRGNRIAWEFADHNRRTIVGTISQPSGRGYAKDPGTLVFSGGFALLEEGFSGPVEVLVAGSGGANLLYTAAVIEAAPYETEEDDLIISVDGVTAEYRLPINSGFYTRDGSMLPYRVNPFILDSRTFMGLRDVSEMIGVPEQDIVWDAASSTVTIRHQNAVIQVQANSREIIVGEGIIQMDTAPVIREGRIMLPISPLMRVFGIDYRWESETSTLIFNR